ncbi:MAG: rod shape-determining protein MreD [Chloroflexi bacterium]|nr:rod shape-determining protein MreD [Chloroflexota bacterium]
MGRFLSLPLLALAAVLQATLVPQIRFGGGGPDLVFLMVLAWSINADLDESLIWAFVGGIALDLLSAAPLGTSTMGMVLVVFVVSGLNRQVYRVGFLLLSVLVLVGSAVQQIAIMIILSVAGFTIALPFDLSYVVAPTIIYNFVMIWPIYWVIRRIQRRSRGEKPYFTAK